MTSIKTQAERPPGSMSERRRERIRLEVSREACRLFWEQGVAATTGEQIAEAVGLSVRTLWRYFRTKESCAEPIVGQGVAGLVELFDRWPAGLSLEDHFGAELRRRAASVDAQQGADDLLSVRMIGLAEREPDLRAAWLAASDRVETLLTEVAARRLGSVPDAPDVRRHSAAAAAVIRVVNEDVSRDLLAGRVERVDAADLARRVAEAVRTATGGALGDAVA